MDCIESSIAETPSVAYSLLFKAVVSIPTQHYLLGLAFLCAVFLYNFLEFHFLEDLLSGFRGSPVSLTYNPCSEFYQGVVSKCKIIHGRYLATPWLSSPHFQTSFINFFGRPPVFRYRRQMFNASDGGTFALDWVLNSDVSGNATDKNIGISKDDTTPIVVVIPGLTSDSASPYLKHLAFNTAKCGWNVVVSNHRGLGGVSVTSDAFYNAGWTEDIRTVLKYLHKEYPKAPIFVVGTSIGANILVKYLGEDGDNVPVAGAVAVCSPWDLLIGSRFISRKLVQRLYDRALTIGLQGYAQMHEQLYSRLANWEGIIKSRTLRDFDAHATCHVGKFETVDSYYRHCSSAPLVGLVSVPLLCISTLDDPVCTAEAIPWDECRANKNIVLAVTKHGGHLAFFEGITASGLWWVRAVNEFIGVLHSSPLMHKSKQVESSEGLHSPSSIDQGPYISMADGMVAAMNSEQPTFENITEETQQTNIKAPDAETSDDISSKTASKDSSFLKRCLHYLGQQSKSRKSIWLLVYVALVSGSALSFLFKRRTKKILAAKPPQK
ncbi:embryogenesis-associated protein EMB8-like [Ipomoea triloba]|uniref:embryogenesis-associated protein EMB8-like n=1 Tax=Ipomoea triloba TaxID=35885 RepID=UPI00125DFE48|nr:embryogenesis-associated protein EMB8-like [Ipomoea triloba]